MTREELLALLLVERHAPRPARPPHIDTDDEVATARRRAELDDALEGFDTPTVGPIYPRRTA